MIILGLGTNLGDREGHLRKAVQALRSLLSSMRCSAVYESDALLPDDAAEDWNRPFLNMAVCGETALAPEALLVQTQALENTLGRIRRGVWGPREIDIDLLACDGIVLDTPQLTLPHRELLTRAFALIPLCDIAPDWMHPVQGKSAHDLAEQMRSSLKKTDIIIS